ncbi:MAG: hypothetical protein NVS2B7_35200 [Herpetosiphon sp.]
MHDDPADDHLAETRAVPGTGAPGGLSSASHADGPRTSRAMQRPVSWVRTGLAAAILPLLSIGLGPGPYLFLIEKEQRLLRGGLVIGWLCQAILLGLLGKRLVSFVVLSVAAALLVRMIALVPLLIEGMVLCHARAPHFLDDVVAGLIVGVWHAAAQSLITGRGQRLRWFVVSTAVWLISSGMWGVLRYGLTRYSGSCVL